jgi:metal-dependent amidase/aminoacylase/carboxypeptidase family protein
MTIPNPETARDSLVAKLQTISDFQHVYDHLTKDTQGQSPIAMITRAGIEPTETPTDDATLAFIVAVWVDRSDASAAERALDRLAQKVVDTVHDWYGAYFVGPSDISNEEADNQAGQYVTEWFSVEVDWQPEYT